MENLPGGIPVLSLPNDCMPNRLHKLKGAEMEKRKQAFGAGKKYKRSGLKENEAHYILETLLDHMEENKPYLNRDYTIDDLSNELKIPRHHITQVINQNLNKNFYAFINEYRIKEFINRLADPQNRNLKIIALAFESGFDSKTSFNMIFKKMQKITPSEFRKSLINNSEVTIS